jgi:hypothetical protein
VYRVLVGKPEGKKPLGRPRRGWEDRIRMDLREICGGAKWIVVSLLRSITELLNFVFDH